TVPTRAYAVMEPVRARSTLRVAVESGFAHPMGRVVVDQPMHWVVDKTGSRNLLLAYFPVDSILEVVPVVPDVANLKMPQHLLFSSSHYCERVVVLRPGLWLLLPGLHQL